MKHRSKIFFIICVALFSETTCIEQLCLSHLDTLIKEVIKQNPDLAATRSRIKAAKIKVPRVQILDDPNFIYRSINHSIGPQREFKKQDRYKFRQKFPFPGKLRLRGEIAKQELEFLRGEEITTYRELILQTKVLYFQLYFNKIAFQINRQNHDIVSRLIGSALALYKTGQNKKDDVLKGQIDLQLLDDELLQLESERETLIALLNALRDKPPSTPVGEPQENFTPDICLNYNDLETIAIHERSELYSLEAHVKEQKKIAALAKREYFPDLTFEFMVQTMPKDNKSAWGINLEINIPFWINVRQKREIQEAEAQSTAYRQEYYGLRARIKSRIKEVLAKINATEERIKLYKTGLIPKTIETLASNESNYLVGKSDFLTVLDTRRQLHDVQLRYEQARVEREILLAELERAIGVPLEKISNNVLSVNIKNVPLTYNKFQASYLRLQSNPLKKPIEQYKARRKPKRKKRINKKQMELVP